VTDGRDRLARGDELLDESNRLLVLPQGVRVRDASRQDERVEVTDPGIGDGQVDLVRVALVEVVEPSPASGSRGPPRGRRR